MELLGPIPWEVIMELLGPTPWEAIMELLGSTPWGAIMELLGPTMGSHYGIIRAYHGKPLWNY